MTEDIAKEIGTLYLEIRSINVRLRDARTEGRNLAEILKEIVEVLDARNDFGPRVEKVHTDGFTASYKRGQSRVDKVHVIPENIRDVLKDICDCQEALKEAREKLRLAEAQADNAL